MRRQPLAARVWGSLYRTWFPPDTQPGRAKRRSAKRERAKVKKQIRQELTSR